MFGMDSKTLRCKKKDMQNLFDFCWLAYKVTRRKRIENEKRKTPEKKQNYNMRNSKPTG